MSNSAISSVPSTQNTILQTVQTILAAGNTFSITTSWSDITDGTTTMSATITPASSSNKVLILVNLNLAKSLDTSPIGLGIHNGTSLIGLGGTGGSRTSVTGSFMTASGGGNIDAYAPTLMYLDSPSTTSAITYKIQAIRPAGNTTLYINRTSTDTNSSSFQRGISTLTLIEIKG